MALREPQSKKRFVPNARSHTSLAVVDAIREPRIVIAISRGVVVTPCDRLPVSRDILLGSARLQPVSFASLPKEIFKFYSGLLAELIAIRE